MIDVCSLREGDAPLLISVPHDGCHLPSPIRERMTSAGLSLPDTDWHVSELYAFASELGASLLVANYSRYVVDLNRPSSDEALYENALATGVCPHRTFAGKSIYRDGEAPQDAEKRTRIANYWQPYHDKISSTLEDIRERFDFALLWDAHSIAREVPLLFKGILPDLNIGTDDDRSCAPHITAAVASVAEASPYSSVTNGRFRGGYITRHYGRPGSGIHAMQLELTQCNYMDEKNLGYDAARAARLVETITNMLEAFQEAAAHGARVEDFG